MHEQYPEREVIKLSFFLDLYEAIQKGNSSFAWILCGENDQYTKSFVFSYRTKDAQLLAKSYVALFSQKCLHETGEPFCTTSVTFQECTSMHHVLAQILYTLAFHTVFALYLTTDTEDPYIFISDPKIPLTPYFTHILGRI